VRRRSDGRASKVSEPSSNAQSSRAGGPCATGLGSSEGSSCRFARVGRNRADDLGPVEQSLLLFRREPILDVPVLEDLVERPSSLVLADHVHRDPLLLGAPLEEKREQVLEDLHRTRLYPRCMRRTSREGRYAERELVGVDDVGEEERILFWIERRPGAVWAVGRAVNPQLRDSDEPRPEDVIFEGFELEDALEHANEALEDDVNVLERDGISVDAKPFTRKEVLPLLERWFFNR
jgi:hypothetical protein